MRPLFIIVLMLFAGAGLFSLSAKEENKILNTLAGTWKCPTKIPYGDVESAKISNGYQTIIITKDKHFTLTAGGGYTGLFTISNGSTPKKGILVITRKDSAYPEVYEYTVINKNKVGFRSIGDSPDPEFYKRKK